MIMCCDKMKKRFIILVLFMIGFLPIYTQKLVVKTNLLYWATLSPTIGVEAKLNNHSTVELTGAMNLFEFRENKKCNFLAIRPEYRYWLCQSFSGHFIGAHLLYSNYNGGLEKHRYNGNLYGAGINYGYQWFLSHRWNIEATAGLGYVYLDHDVYNRQRCGRYLGHETRNYLGLTRLGLSIIYVIK